MQAELIMVGTELLLGEIVDTNATFLARNLADMGIDVFYKSTVGDNLGRIQGILGLALDRSDVVILSGGLGPTDDDLTREAVSHALGRPLMEDQDALREIEAWFEKRYGYQVPMPEHNRKQALFPMGSQIVPNPVGTAPGFWVEKDGKIVIALPGVSQELQAMFTATVAGVLLTQAPGQALVTRNLHFVGIGESSLEALLDDLISAQTSPTLALYASGGTVRVRLAVKAVSRQAGLEAVAPLEREIRQRAQDYFYGVDGQTLEEAVASKLMDGGVTLALAESCTGGLLGHRLTNVPGSSAFLDRGYVVYSNRAKMEELGVKEATLQQFGAVSAETVQEMAQGARLRSKTDLGLAITGIAGPGGGTPQKPVGLVYISLASSGDTIVQRHLWKGTREQVKDRTALAALQLLWQTNK